MQESASLQIQSPSLPKGGGTLSGMGESLSAAGPDGTASFTVPLPVSAGRGFAPGPALSYSSEAGSSEFGMGWECQILSFSFVKSGSVASMFSPVGYLTEPYRESRGLHPEGSACIPYSPDYHSI